MTWIKPHPLREGARVALIAPAGPVASERIDLACRRVRSHGWVPVLGAHASSQNGYLSASDELRAEDLNWAIESADIDAVWCLRGGYGLMRILDQIRWDHLRENPKPYIGYSDITAGISALFNRRVVCFHGPVAAEPELSSFTDLCFSSMMRGSSHAELRVPSTLPAPHVIRSGVAEGRLIGGNLAMLAALCGTPYMPDTTGAILLLEEIGEYPYRVDRLLTQLRLSGALRRAAGIAVGGLTDCGDALPVVIDRLGDLGIPVAANLPFGHIPSRWTIPMGVAARLDAAAGAISLLESPFQ